MTPPSKDEITRSLEALRKCASEWKETSDALRAVAVPWAGEIANGMTFGFFTPVGLKYEAACKVMSDAAVEGGSKLEMVSLTLTFVANAYEQDEENNVHLAQKKW